MSENDYLRRLRVLGAWWRLGSSAVEPRLLADLAAGDPLDPVEPALAAHGGVALTDGPEALLSV